jgi:hypothetical protein
MGDVTFTLTRLIVNGNLAATVEELADAEIVVTKRQLRDWRDRVFRNRYFTLRQELARDAEEEIAGRAFERALQADQMQELIIGRAGQKVGCRWPVPSGGRRVISRYRIPNFRVL